MKDPDCVELLQWALPRLRLRWAGFRKVRGQVCKRIGRRFKELGLADLDAYRDYLEKHTEEWEVLDGFCRITISRFHRDRLVFEYLRDTVFPELAVETEGDEGRLRCWTAGCASGEEPFTLCLLWHFYLRKRFPDVSFEIVATDAEPKVLERARAGCFKESSFRELAPELVEAAFEPSTDGQCLRPEFRTAVEFRLEDIRQKMPEGPCHLILCRNLVFTYFECGLQCELLERMLTRLVPGGVLVIGSHESLPEGTWPLMPHDRKLSIYRKVPD